MEGSESEAIFDSFNLNPQLFINEVLNAVDDMVDGAFEFYEQDASKLLARTGADQSDELKKGISSIRHMIQVVLNRRMGMWEKYCLRHCFTVPEGFSLTKSSPDDTPMDLDAPSDAELDAQLDSLRDKLSAVGNESVELQRELQALEKQSIINDSYAGSVNEALQLFEQNSMYETSQEIIRVASELRTRMEKMEMKRKEEIDHIRVERIYKPNRDQTLMKHI
ncbi:protein MIS12 homolog [Macadamia integrifolia]|uniref:protein MIS12 homolog n=1 Tax=Macadamia integrifolia TaxID=60698 RepID=UPI001C4F6F12|nr:protein MIS12 homolog [Macadamia integrifolia]XP_042483081.1 protein MIS12 homolog [Macadamia integrifolia]